MTKKNLEIQTPIATIKVVDGWPSKNIIPIDVVKIRFADFKNFKAINANIIQNHIKDTEYILTTW